MAGNFVSEFYVAGRIHRICALSGDRGNDSIHRPEQVSSGGGRDFEAQRQSSSGYGANRDDRGPRIAVYRALAGDR